MFDSGGYCGEKLDACHFYGPRVKRTTDLQHSSSSLVQSLPNKKHLKCIFRLDSVWNEY